MTLFALKLNHGLRHFLVEFNFLPGGWRKKQLIHTRPEKVPSHGLCKQRSGADRQTCILESNQHQHQDQARSSLCDSTYAFAPPIELQGFTVSCKVGPEALQDHGFHRTPTAPRMQ